MLRFKRWNNITGWLTFLIASITYLLTLEPSVSFWDCGEFISCAFKLEVGHPPGAPLFLMMAKVFSLVAPGKTNVAIIMNAMSALASAFTVLFLFWTITHLARKIVVRDNTDMSTGKLIAVIGAGLTGALAFAFSDTFWFSAVETEVYATSSLFTAVVFWSILKWEEAADGAYANRWLILIAYLMGLSIGVHLLNLLTIPAITLVFYYRRFKPSWYGFLLAVFISFIILACVQYGVISWSIKLAETTELFFVNDLKMPYNSGAIGFAIGLMGILIGGIWLTFKIRKIVLNTILLAFTMLILGYGSYAMILIRSNAGTPLNENRPDNIFALLSYLDRDQYGESPLFYGPYYNAPILKVVDGKPAYAKKDGKYVIVDRQQGYVYDPRFMTFFPRMYSTDKVHVSIYKEWARIKGKPMTITKDGEQVVESRPTFKENLLFFFKYQIGYMYTRYFMWNFSGRQNEIDGNGGIMRGNWITSFDFLDNIFLGPQDQLPSYLKNNKGHNKYYLLPFLLGVIGLIYQFRRSKQGLSIISLLFFMTGIAVVIFLNQSPLQPRERDYAYVGSFYAFAIWIGLGVLAIIKGLEKWFTPTKASFLSVSLCLLAVPMLMAFQNSDDHNRSGRNIAHDVAYDYLNSCAPNAILFTNGDNDTFPLWYLQEVEGVRTDVRVVNLTLLDADWYIDQLKQKVYNAEPVPISIDSDKYLSRRRNFIYFIPKRDDYMTLKEAVSFVASDDPKTKLEPEPDMVINYIPTRNLILPVDTLAVVTNGTVKPERTHEILAQLPINVGHSYISRGQLIVMDILAQNNWRRPVYYISPNQDGVLGLNEYLQLDGFAYRLVPIFTKKIGRFSNGRVESSILYSNLMNNFRWGNITNPDIFIDDTNKGTFTFLRARVNFARLAEQLYAEGKRDSAMTVLNRCLALMPSKTFPHDIYSTRLIEAAYTIGATQQAHQVMDEYAQKCFEEIRFYYAMPKRLFRLTEYENIVAQQTVKQLEEIAGKFGDTKVQEDLEKEFGKYVKQ